MTKKVNMFTMVFTAIMAALIILMTVTGIGYIPIGPFKLTLNTLPVAVGALVCGPIAGAVLGLVFGLTSFATCIFGMDALGVVILGLGWKQAVCLFVACVVPRVLCGWIPGLLYKWFLEKTDHRLLTSGICCGLTSALNTVLFIGSFWLFYANDFMHSEKLISLFGGAVKSIIALFLLFAGWNALIEIAVNILIGTAVVTAIQKQRL